MRINGKETLKRVWKRFLNALFPDDLKCVVCGAELRTDESRLCGKCAPYVQEISGNVCPVCGYLIDESGRCPDCGFKEGQNETNAGSGKNRFRFRKLSAIYPYDGKIKKLVLDMKDGGKPWLSQWFSERLSAAIQTSGERYDAILYPPSSVRTVRRRGFDHMKLVAKQVSETTGIPYLQVFSKTSDGEKQAKKGKQERIESTAKEYSLLFVPEGTRFAIVDDVATTCATMDTLAGLLKHANPDAEVDCYTFARTLFKK